MAINGLISKIFLFVESLKDLIFQIQIVKMFIHLIIMLYKTLWTSKLIGKLYDVIDDGNIDIGILLEF